MPFVSCTMKALIFLAIVLFSSHFLPASDIASISFDQLESISKYVVVGVVTTVKPQDTLDQVEIAHISNLKGKFESKSFTLTLQVRGGLKEFDPQLKVGDTAIFYLKEHNSKISLAYPGAIAFFQKMLFDHTHKSN